MKKLWMLMKAILISEENEGPKQENKGKIYKAFGILAILVIIVPSCLIVGFLAYLMTLALLEAGSNQEGLLFILHFLSVSAMIFGFQVVLSTFYFSSDVERLLPLPIKVSEIILVKFIKTYLAESGMEMFILLSAMIGYYLAAPKSPVGILAAVLGVFTVPLMPLLFCGIISMLLLYVTTWIRSKKQVSMLVWGIATVMMVFVFWAIGGISGLEVENFVAGMQNGSNLFMESMNILFFQNDILTKAMAHRSIGYLIVYVLCNAGMLMLFLGLANVIYFPGLCRIRSVGNKSKTVSAGDLADKCKKKSADLAYMRKELLLLFRTGSYVANCVLMTYVWPVVIGIFLLWKGKGMVLQKYRTFLENGRGGVDILLLLLVILIAVLTPGANAIAATSFTREGRHIDFMKYIPVSYERQIRAKAWIGIMVSYSSVVFSILWIALYFRMGLLRTIYMLLISFWAVVLVTALGIWLDSMHPRLLWEDETAAMRGNLNVFFNMAFAMLLGGFLCLLAYVLYVPSVRGRLSMHVLYLAFLFLAGYWAYRSAVKTAVRELQKR